VLCSVTRWSVRCLLFPYTPLFRSLLGAGAAGAVAQILQHRRGGRHVGNADELAVEHEPRRLCVGKDVTHDKGLTLGVRISYRGKWNSSMAILGEARDSPAPGLRPRMQ